MGKLFVKKPHSNMDKVEWVETEGLSNTRKWGVRPMIEPLASLRGRVFNRDFPVYSGSIPQPAG
jgi:hypothetical protein